MNNLRFQKTHSAFTLTEILMTLLIIGIVAAMTIPALISNQQEQSTISKLKKAHANITQAIELSESDNSFINNWTFPTAGNLAELKSWFNIYLGPYIKFINVIDKTNSIIVKMPDGVDVEFEMTSEMNVKLYTNGYAKSNFVGKSIFYYEMIPNTMNNPFRPYEEGATGLGRSKWTTGTYACTKTNTMENRRYCTGLLVYDNWEFRSDYPW